MQGSVVVAVYPSRALAEIARGLLDSDGIPAEIHADDTSGMSPELSVTNGVRLVVPDVDAQRARDLLDQHEPATPSALPPPSGPAPRLIAGMVAAAIVAGTVLTLLQQVL